MLLPILTLLATLFSPLPASATAATSENAYATETSSQILHGWHTIDYYSQQTLSSSQLDNTMESNLPAGFSTNWWAAAQQQIRGSEYQITFQDATYLSRLGGAYQAPNRAHNIRTYFTPSGVSIIPRTDVLPRWELSMVLTGYGYGGYIQRKARVIAERPDAAFAQDDLLVALGEDVFGGHQPFFDRGSESAFEKHRLFGLARLHEKVVVLHISRTDLNDVGISFYQLNVSGIHYFGNDRH